MYGTELLMERKKVRDQLVGEALGPARSAGYYDAREAMSLIQVHATGGFNGARARVVLAYAFYKGGVPLDDVCEAYDVNPEDVTGWNATWWTLTELQRRQIEETVTKLVPETPEPQRHVAAVPYVGALRTDQNAGPPMSPDNTSIVQGRAVRAS